jgi:hypothetical protein
MSIKFTCVCGKHLKAREEMAGRRSMCPTCGAPVGIPMLRPTHRGVALGHMSPTEQLRTRRCVPAAAQLPEAVVPPVDSPEPGPRVLPKQALALTFDGPLDTAIVQEVLARCPEREPQAPVSRWYHSLIYCFRALPIMIVLAIVLGMVTAAANVLLPEALELSALAAGTLAVLLLPLVLPFFCFLTFLLDGALASALAGQTRVLYCWPGHILRPAVKIAGCWLLYFLAGPVLPIAGAFFFWMYCGDPQPIDWLILAELVIMAVGYGLFMLLSVHDEGRLTGLLPLRVLDTAYRLGYRGAAVALALSAFVIGHVLVLAAVVNANPGPLIHRGHAHHAQNMTWPILIVSWFAILFAGTLSLRLLGHWCRLTRREVIP